MPNNIEKTVVFIKPNYIKFKKKIISILKKEFKLIKIFQIDKIPEDFIYKLYGEYKNEWFFEKLINYYKDKKIIVIFIEGKDIMKRLSCIIGEKDPSKSHKNSIRNIFSNDDLTMANKEKRIIDNVIHFQENKIKMDYEINILETYINKQ